MGSANPAVPKRCQVVNERYGQHYQDPQPGDAEEVIAVAGRDGKRFDDGAPDWQPICSLGSHDIPFPAVCLSVG